MVGYNELMIEKLEDFEKIISKYKYREMLYRGQSDSTWGLLTSLYRLFNDLTAIFNNAGIKRRFSKNNHENNLIAQFKMSAHLYLNSLPSKASGDLLEWVAIMQHHGTPTRLLDVTTSPYVALHFALEVGNKDAAIFAINHKSIISENIRFHGKDYKSNLFDNLKGNESFVTPFEPLLSSDRLKAQQGLFLVPSNNYEIIDTILKRYECFDEAVTKIIIPSKLRLDGIRRLRKMNITSDTLFPGIDGFCKSLGFLAIEKYTQLKRIE